jgi:peptide/nickel transport system permease protein
MARESAVLTRQRFVGPFGSLRAGLHFLRRWPVIPILIMVMMVTFALFAPQIAPHSPIAQSLSARNQPPAWYAEGTREYLLGADYVGRDVLSRVIHGARVSLMVAGVSLASGLVLGSTLGLLSGWYGGFIDEIISRIVDVWQALPFLLVALVIVIVFGHSITVMMGVLALVAWSAFVRNIRAEVLSLKTRDYVSLAKVSGASTPRLLIRHILPGVMNTIIVIATLRVGGLILTEATLSFLGAGIPKPTPAWGLMVAEGRDYLDDAWWITVFPGIAIFLVVMSLNFMGDWMRDRFDPTLRQLD